MASKKQTREFERRSGPGSHFETLLGGCREHSGPFGIVFRPILGRCGVNLGTSSEEPSRTIKLVGGIGRQAFSIVEMLLNPPTCRRVTGMSFWI